MKSRPNLEKRSVAPAGDAARDRLLAGLPVTERRLVAAGVPTAVLEGGDGPPLLLLHGPGESSVNWRWVIPELVATWRVVAPDLLAHGGSDALPGRVATEAVLDWMSDLIARTCATPPAVVGHVQCAHDPARLRARMGEDWSAFVTHNLEAARSPKAKAAGRLFRRIGLPSMTPEDLERIPVPTALIWGRHDRANRLSVAQAASDRYAWPLHVVDDAADDPARDQPRAFLDALHLALG